MLKPPRTSPLIKKEKKKKRKKKQRKLKELEKIIIIRSEKCNSMHKGANLVLARINIVRLNLFN